MQMSFSIFSLVKGFQQQAKSQKKGRVCVARQAQEQRNVWCAELSSMDQMEKLERESNMKEKATGCDVKAAKPAGELFRLEHM